MYEFKPVFLQLNYGDNSRLEHTFDLHDNHSLRTAVVVGGSTDVLASV